MIPEEVLSIYKKIEDAGFQVFFVGGSVRNLLLKRDVVDWDLTTNAIPDQILKIFPNGLTVFPLLWQKKILIKLRHWTLLIKLIL